MNQEPNKQVVFDAGFIFGIIRRYAKQLSLIAGGTVALSIFFSSELFIKPKYKSTAIVYPSNLIPYSTESPTEQMIQLFGSDEIRDELIKDFKLFEHYEIDTNIQYPLTTLHGMMQENITVDKTKFESVEINVLDTDPKIASAIVDSIISKFHKKAKTLQRTKSAEVVVILGNQLKLKTAEIDSMEKRILELRTTYGILDFGQQIRSFSRTYYEELAKGNAGTGNARMDKVMETLGAKGTEYIALSEILYAERAVFIDIKKRYDEVLKDLTKELTYSNVVSPAVPAEKKSYPVRSLIVLFATISALAISLLTIIILENRKRLSANQANQ
jgi:uncharacterized protein involved in exopolysaccharide biosynthesis